MANRSSTYGPEPGDEVLFADKGLDSLRAAAEDIGWLVGRGYPREDVLGVVSKHRGLSARQEFALDRAACSEPQYRRRAAREMDEEDLARCKLAVDLQGQLHVLEVAFAGGYLFHVLDGSYRCLVDAGGTFETTSNTEAGLDLMMAQLAVVKPSRVTLCIDRDLGAGESLLTMGLAAAKKRKLKAEGATVALSSVLKKSAGVVSSDPDVLDTCASWLNLSSRLVPKVQNARIVTIP
jgi:hypothetical protein